MARIIRTFFTIGKYWWLGAVLLAGGCAGGITGDDILPRPGEYEVGGIDVSKYQGDIDWNSVRGSGVRFAWIKATEGGDRVDEKFAQNWAAAKVAGVPRGAYHFAYWCRPMQEQAAWFKAHVPNDPSALPPVLDVEWNGYSKTCPKRVPRDFALAQMKIMLAAMEEAYGKKPVIYTSIDFHRDVMQGEFTDYPIWVRSVKCHPSLKYGARRWHFWQHTAEGRIAGIRGNVDRNAFNGSLKQWQAWLATNKSFADSTAPGGRGAEKSAAAAHQDPAQAL
jgi:lysozyme